MRRRVLRRPTTPVLLVRSVPVRSVLVRSVLVRPVLVLPVLVLALWASAARPAEAQTEPYTIERFDVTIAVAPDGRLLVTEEIDVRFDAERRGIFRRVPVRYDLTAEAQDLVPPGEDVADFWRVVRLDDVGVSVVGAPDDVEVTVPSDRRPDQETEAEIRVGEEDTFVTGPVSYTISYAVDGALNETSEGPELFWNATGNGWDTTIAQARVEVTDAEVTLASCFQGRAGAAQLCDAPPSADGDVVAAATDLAAGEGLTIVARLAPSAVTVPDPIVVRRWGLRDAFVGASFAVPLAGGLAVLGLAGLAVLGLRQGRDRELRGDVDVHGHVDPSAVTRRRLFSEPTTPVEFRPPDGLRPGQLGLVVDERVDDVDVAGTIVDLAVRGHLAIEPIEAEKALVFTSTDWRLVRGEGGDALLPYEQTLVDGLFGDDVDEVLLSDLEGGFATTYARAVRQIYEDGSQRGWFGGRPDEVRNRWGWTGIGVLVVGIVATVVAALLTRFALVAAVVPVLGIALIGSASRMPHRTPRGSALLVRTLGFRRFVVTAEASRMDFAEKERIFVEYLPYAIVFDVVDRWTRTFEGLGVDVAAATSGFYVHHGAFSTHGFSNGVQSFAASASSSLSTAPSASGGSGFSGGGFSGGGMGGGGGGSW